MKPAELLTVALSIPLVVGVLAANPLTDASVRRAPVASQQAALIAPPVLLEEVVVTAKRLDPRK